MISLFSQVGGLYSPGCPLASSISWPGCGGPQVEKLCSLGLGALLYCLRLASDTLEKDSLPSAILQLLSRMEIAPSPQFNSCLCLCHCLCVFRHSHASSFLSISI